VARGVTCRFIGRLGNNMFQAAAVVGYSKTHCVPWEVPAVNKESPRFKEFFPLLQYGNRTLQVFNCHEPKMFSYQRLPFWPQGICLTGFFQTLKYFEHCQDEIKRLFKLNTVTGYEDYVSIHVRRGDYVRYSTHFPPVTMTYLNNAMAHFPGRKFLVFSDDLGWCQANIKNAEFPNGDELADLSLMASCGGHIIANSTFSWWGAYLGVNPDKKIVTPDHRVWFGRHNGVKLAQMKDIIPKGWIEIL